MRCPDDRLGKALDKRVLRRNNVAAWFRGCTGGALMTRRGRKGEIVTFKVDDSVLQAMKAVPNRSEFIRTAILAALDGVCPLCAGTGVLTPNQKRHWETFAARHSLEECDGCHEFRLVCAEGEGEMHSHVERQA